MQLGIIGTFILLLLFGCKKSQNERTAEKDKLFLKMRWVHQTDFNPTIQEMYSQYASAHFTTHYMTQVGTPYQVVDPGEVHYGDSLLRPTSTKFWYAVSSSVNSSGFLPALEAGKPWIVTGIPGSVPAFSTPGLPVPSFIYKTIDTLPVLKAANSFTITWDNTLPSETLQITLNLEPGYPGPTKVYNIGGNVSSLTIPATDVSAVTDWATATTKGYIRLSGTRTKEMVIEGVPVQVRSEAIRIIQVKLVR